MPSSIPTSRAATFPSKALAGVGVIFYVLLALRARLRELDWFARRRHCRAEPGRAARSGGAGQRRRRGAAGRQQPHPGPPGPGAHPRRPGAAGPQGDARSGRQASAERITSTDLGFILGPRLNAAGRLDDMSLGIECLLCEDEALARDMAVAARPAQPGPQGHRAGHAARGAGPVEGFAAGRDAVRPVPVRAGMAPGGDRHPRLAPEGALPPPDHRLRRGRRRHAQGLGALGAGLAYPRCAGRGGRPPSGADQQVRRPCHGRRAVAAAGELRRLRRRLRCRGAPPVARGRPDRPPALRRPARQSRSSTWNWPGRCARPARGASTSPSRCSMACSSWSSSAWSATST